MFLQLVINNKRKKNRTLQRTILIAITKAINITLRHIDKLLQTDIIDLRYIEKHPQKNFKEKITQNVKMKKK